MTATAPTEDPRYFAAVDLIGRTGATSYQIRYSDDEQPVVWMAVADYKGRGWEVGAGHDPVEATLRLLEQLVDGGTCTHCRRPAGFEPDSLDALPADEHVCWYQYDPELRTFRRACEGAS